MQKYKNRIIAFVVIASALFASFLYGGNYNRNDNAALSASAPINSPAQAAETLRQADGAAEVLAEAGLGAVSAETRMDIDPNTGKDRYQTDPVPIGKPLPVEPGDTAVGDEAFAITLSVYCDTILGNMHLLNKEKWELVPEDGVILPPTEAVAYEGESVFNILQREMKRAGIHMEFMNTPIYNSAYIEGINNLYEFDTGELSGWMYAVNGWYPNYGCSRYRLKPGDVVEWRYTCDLGRDLGEYSLGGWQMDE